MSNRPLILDGNIYYLDACPTCKGLAIVLNTEPSDEYADWADIESCKDMITYCESQNPPIRVTKAEKLRVEEAA